ncbi:MAG TPA: hypothetical protein VFU11_12235 [Solirubrobacterales bacterium]|nr:hypothetical protein [Solirubrobacterales bacterium]
MNDDWRLQVDFRADGLADALHDRLDAQELEHDLSEAFHDRVIVSRDEATIFLYAGDKEQAEKARDLVVRLTAEDDEEVTIDFRRWHPLSLEWRPADESLPDDAAARLAEHQERIARERQETEEQGYPRYEVQVKMSSWAEADAFQDRLRDEGLPAVQRWSVVLIGTADEDAANELAERVRGEVPAGTIVAVAGTLHEAEDDVPRPFAFLGGLAG